MKREGDLFSRLNYIDKSNKKAQGAMEFLMTYGWAVLVVLLAIGALTYFGTGISKPTPNVCLLPPGFGCREFQVTTTGVDIVIQNSRGADINNIIVNITKSPYIFTETVDPNSLKDGEARKYTISLTSGTINLGKKFKGDIVITYKKVGGSLSNTGTGSVSGKSETTGTTPALPGGTGSIYTTSTPPGAWIILNGINQSRVTDNTISGLTTGILYTTTVKRCGYNVAPASIPITIPANGTSTAAFTLTSIGSSCQGTPYHPGGELGSGPLEHFLTCTEIISCDICVQVVGCHWG